MDHKSGVEVLLNAALLSDQKHKDAFQREKHIAKEKWQKYNRITQHRRALPPVHLLYNLLHHGKIFFFFCPLAVFSGNFWRIFGAKYVPISAKKKLHTDVYFHVGIPFRHLINNQLQTAN